MAIDDPKTAFEKEYMHPEEPSPLPLTVFVAKLAFPKAALPLEIFRKVADRLQRPSVEERLQSRHAASRCGRRSTRFSLNLKVGRDVRLLANSPPSLQVGQ
jgi:hypothetical protein